MRKLGTSSIDVCNLAQGGTEATPRARRNISYCVGNVSAEMATVLRIDAIILIRLREKMEVHLCTVFQSTCNPIILTRYAFKHRMLQEHDEIYRLCTHTATSTNATF